MKKEEIRKQLEEELQRLMEISKGDTFVTRCRSDVSKQIFTIASYLLDSKVEGNMTKEDIKKCLEEELKALPDTYFCVLDVDSISERCKVSEQIFKIAAHLLKTYKMQEQRTQSSSMEQPQQEQAQPIKPKLDKEHFLQSVAGKTLINIAENAYNTAKTLQPDREYWAICVSSALSILHLLHYCYGVKYRIVINDDSFSIESQDGTDVLYSYTEKE